MTFTYITHWRIPSEKAPSLFIARSLQAFVAAGNTVTLWVPRRRHELPVTFDAYGISLPTLEIKQLWCIDFMRVRWLGRISFWLLAISFAMAVWVEAIRTRARNTIFFAHDPRDVWLLTRTHREVYMEVHDFYESSFGIFNRWGLRACAGFFVTNAHKIMHLQSKHGIPKEHMILVRNAVDYALFFLESITRDAARVYLRIPSTTKKIILYSGNLYAWKGVKTFFEAANLAPQYEWYCVGGTEADIAFWRDTYGTLPQLHFVGFRPHTEIPYWQRAADILVLPNTATSHASQFETSPMKVYEYLASGTRIIAADTSSIREIITDEMGEFITPDSPEALIECIAIEPSPEYAQAQRDAAQSYARAASWEQRATTIISFTKHIQESRQRFFNTKK